MELNDEQKACVAAVDGTYLALAGPGSGKTSTLVQRYLSMLTSGIPSKDILNLTFTSAGAEAMVRKVGLLDAEKVFRTFHSFCIELLKKERDNLPFKLNETVIPVSLEDYKLLFDLVKRYPAIKNFRSLQERISTWKRTNVEPTEAKELAVGEDYFYALAYEDYEIECRQEGWLDFDSLIREAVNLLETNEEVRNRWKRKYISVDEFQDTDEVQVRLLRLLFDGNIFAVGDINQCQPPGTKISTVVSPAHGRTAAIIKEKNIEDLNEDDRLVSWEHSHGTGRLRLSGRKFRVSSRLFKGRLLIIQNLDGDTTKITPDHFLWVRFSKKFFTTKPYFVYLMYRCDRGFRIGVSHIRHNRGGNALTQRGRQELAERFWILSFYPDRAAAETQEEILSLRFRVPQSVFHKYNGVKITDAQIQEIFNSVSRDGGFQCLEYFGKLFESPLAQWPAEKLQKFHGFFKTAAANVIPEIMELPTQFKYRTSPIVSIKSEDYEGMVYSLDVDRDHTYVADGIPVGNCIFEWRSARPQNVVDFHKSFPGVQTLFLGHNYRSTARLVSFFKAILPVDNGIASHMVTDNEEGEDPIFVKYADDQEEAYWVLAQINDPTKTAIIARTNRQLFLFQRICTMRNIKYQILGKKDFFELNEVKRLLTLAKEDNSQRPASIVLAETIEKHDLMKLYKHSITRDSNPIENLNDVVKLAANRGTIAEFTAYLRKRMHGRKSNKGLTLSTVHQIKGREAKNVFFIGCNQGVVPHQDGELQEEKRIFYVGCTRAEKFLQVSYTANPSQFILGFLDENSQKGAS